MTPAPDGSFASAEVRDDAGGGRWRVTDLPVMPGYSASLCLEEVQRPAPGAHVNPRLHIVDLALDEID